MEWSVLPRVCVLTIATALGCSGDARPPGLTSAAIDASLGDALPNGVRGGRGVIPTGGTPSGATTSRDASTSLACRTSAILVVDRSGSMRENTLDGAQKWAALLAALEAVLPRIEHNVALGLVMFPQAVEGGGPRTSDSACALRTTLDLEPQFNAASAIMARLRASPPDGPTPTAGAVEVAGRWFVDHPGSDGDRYLILATDGAPNCNPSLSPSTCTCTGAASSCSSGGGASASINCLDDARTLESIDLFRRREVFTYVVGLNGAEAFSSVLDAMADAGGRARGVTPRFYPANTADDLARELSTITSGIANCP